MYSKNQLFVYSCCVNMSFQIGFKFGYNGTVLSHHNSNGILKHFTYVYNIKSVQKCFVSYCSTINCVETIE